MARELSPFSARRLLTQQMAAAGRNGTPQRNKSRSREPSVRNGSEQSRREPQAVPERRRRRSASASSSTRPRGASPEPYRKPREDSRDRKRHRSRDRRRDRSPERKRSRSRDGRRHRSRDRRRDGSKDKDSHSHSHSRHHRSRSRDRDRKRRDRSKDARRTRKHRTRSPSSSASPPSKRRRRTRTPSQSPSPSPRPRAKKPLPSQEVSFRGLDDSIQPPSKYGGAPPDKERPNFKPTGALAKAANRVEGTKISLKYNEPPEARKPSPSQPWRIFVFKGDDVVDTIEIWQKSCWLLGRAQEVVDYVLEHPSSSGQHAVIQFRYIQKTVEDEFCVKSTRGKVKPYIIDLESSNGTELNGDSIEASRYFELRDKDILKFAGSEREYVVMLPPPEEAR
ncbi:SMAD/FHA domain-containing protein [Paraphoma chrysanthemicola]|uniref:SMAD/FHA domain-containing protein n=1 Tax=Paraphoma chrysanthemicola TaxID=798071 RepID=A0A8K0RJY8_9PLEO|nr:SMAD/FHA domain-containing protein [Paraphoma chrysanthemicola]